jgi:hypothetical protein
VASVYSTRFFAGHNVVGGIGYVVPPGFVAVLRDVWVAERPSLPTDSVGLFNAAGGYLWYVEFEAGTSAFFFWQGRQVFEAGEEIQCIVTSITGVDVQASGYLLSLP